MNNQSASDAVVPILLTASPSIGSIFVFDDYVDTKDEGTGIDYDLENIEFPDIPDEIEGNSRAIKCSIAILRRLPAFRGSKNHRLDPQVIKCGSDSNDNTTLNSECDKSTSETSFDISYHDDDDDDALDNVSYAFSDYVRVHVVESEEDVDSITDVNWEDELILTASDCDDISLLDEDEADNEADFDRRSNNNVPAPSEGSKDISAGKKERVVEEHPYPYEYEDIQPLFQHNSLRQAKASQANTSYDFIISEQIQALFDCQPESLRRMKTIS